MSEILQTEKINLKHYEGRPSTLCVGCGHDSISKHIITACFQSGLPPQQVVKMSGIGCSSKIPAYFMSSSFAFNSMHGRMAAVSTGASLVRRDLNFLGVSGDGDTGNIGLGGFIHLIRRNVPMVYLIANNGVFGLTKGQFSAAADESSLSKSGKQATLPSLDFCALAIQAGCGFVARTFSGDAKQMVSLIQAALRFQGTAVIDILSPCVTFNNHDGSTKSFSHIKEHDRSLQELGFFSAQAEIQADYAPMEKLELELHDGSHLVLRKISDKNFDPRDKMQALQLLQNFRHSLEIPTGLLYFDDSRPFFQTTLGLVEKPLNTYTENDLKPSVEALVEQQKKFQ